jgi:hypothetical protein
MVAEHVASSDGTRIGWHRSGDRRSCSFTERRPRTGASGESGDTADYAIER